MGQRKLKYGKRYRGNEKEKLERKFREKKKMSEDEEKKKDEWTRWQRELWERETEKYIERKYNEKDKERMEIMEKTNQERLYRWVHLKKKIARL